MNTLPTAIAACKKSRYIDDCIGATSSTREDLNQFITAVNSFHPALKHTWEISDTSLAFLDIKVSIEGNGLCTSVHYKPTDSHSYLLYSSSHPSHVKNSIPYSQFLRLRRLCSDDSDFSLKSEEMCDFFHNRGYPASVVRAGHHRAQQIDRQSSLQTSQKENNDKTRQDKTRQLYLTRVAQSAAKLVSLGALGSIRLTYTHLQ